MNQILTKTPTLDVPEQADLHAPRIAILSASWHEDIVANAVTAARDELSRSSTSPPQVELFQVPGAFEIPLHALQLAASGDYDAIIACGLVVNGGIYRHDFVAAAVINGLMQVQLQTAVPVFSAVLTPRDFHEHEEHQRFFREHFVKKGNEVARACMETLNSLAKLRHSASARHRAQRL
ncbi:6,7-dimethyl-8-ribityllumazine synthase [Hylemonella sp. W303a]|uniref:6,7-dimethyl-8-ribityllumazine synthase n=1 Tax=Hylemonella sp. W303a TaxID=3389873 RepID=UPI00396B2D50